MVAKRKPAAAAVAVVAKKRITAKSANGSKQNKKADDKETQPVASIAQATELPAPQVVAVSLVSAKVSAKGKTKKKDDNDDDDKKKDDKQADDKKKGGKNKGKDADSSDTQVKAEAASPETQKEPVAELMEEEEAKPLDAVQLKRMMGVLNDQSTRPGVSAEKKKKADEMLDIWKNKADTEEKRQILASFAQGGVDGIKPADRIKLCLEFRENIRKEKLQTVEQNENFFTRLRGDWYRKEITVNHPGIYANLLCRRLQVVVMKH